MQADHIMFAVSGTVTLGWYAVLHWGLGVL
jgi:hypothetical protein